MVEPTLFFGLPVVTDERGPFDLERELGVLLTYDVTITGAPPTAYRFMLGHPECRRRT